MQGKKYIGQGHRVENTMHNDINLRLHFAGVYSKHSLPVVSKNIFVIQILSYKATRYIQFSSRRDISFCLFVV